MLVLYISLGVALLDQVTKHLVTCNIAFKEQIPVIPGFLNLTYVRNTGAAWGMFAGFSHMLVLLSIVMLILLVFYRRHFMEDRLSHRISMGLIIAGIVGNLIDRVRFGYVIDFIDVYWRSCEPHFPAFNVADSAICIGVGIYLISTLSLGGRPHEAIVPEAA